MAKDVACKQATHSQWKTKNCMAKDVQKCFATSFFLTASVGLLYHPVQQPTSKGQELRVTHIVLLECIYCAKDQSLKSLKLLIISCRASGMMMHTSSSF